MQKLRFAYLLSMLIFTPSTHIYAKQRIPFIRETIQGTWVITHFKSTSIIDGVEKIQGKQASKNGYQKLTFQHNNRFVAKDMSISYPNGDIKTYTFSGEYRLDDSKGIIHMSFIDPTDNQPLELYFKIQLTEEGIELLVNKEELFLSMDFLASKDTFTQSLNTIFKESVQSYASCYSLKKFFQ